MMQRAQLARRDRAGFFGTRARQRGAVADDVTLVPPNSGGKEVSRGIKADETRMEKKSVKRGKVVKVVASSSPYRGRLGRVTSITESQKSAYVNLGGSIGEQRFWVSSLEPVRHRSSKPRAGRTVEIQEPAKAPTPDASSVDSAVLELVEQLGRLARVTADRVEARDSV